MASFNRVILVGNMTRDPELRYIPSGMAVSDIGLAVNDRRKDQNGNWTEETTFVDITLWGRNAEVAAEYARKGVQVLIEGRLKLDSWETDGQKRSKLKVVGERLVLLGSRSSGGEGMSSSYNNSSRNTNYGGGSNSYNAGSYEEAPLPPEASSGDDIPF